MSLNSKETFAHVEAITHLLFVVLSLMIVCCCLTCFNRQLFVSGKQHESKTLKLDRHLRSSIIVRFHFQNIIYVSRARNNWWAIINVSVGHLWASGLALATPTLHGFYLMRNSTICLGKKKLLYLVGLVLRRDVPKYLTKLISFF